MLAALRARARHHDDARAASGTIGGTSPPLPSVWQVRHERRDDDEAAIGVVVPTERLGEERLAAATTLTLQPGQMSVTHAAMPAHGSQPRGSREALAPTPPRRSSVRRPLLT